jgi:hypothetical protein
MRYAILIFVILEASAVLCLSQPAAWTSSDGRWCSFGGPVWPARQGICYAVDEMRVHATSELTITLEPKCDDGWTTLTYPGTTTFVCARELREPQFLSQSCSDAASGNPCPCQKGTHWVVEDQACELDWSR